MGISFRLPRSVEILKMVLLFLASLFYPKIVSLIVNNYFYHGKNPNKNCPLNYKNFYIISMPQKKGQITPELRSTDSVVQLKVVKHEFAQNLLIDCRNSRGRESSTYRGYHTSQVRSRMLYFHMGYDIKTKPRKRTIKLNILNFDHFIEINSIPYMTFHY